MWRFRVVGRSALWMGGLGGCASTRPLAELPDPVFETAPRVRPKPAPVRHGRITRPKPGGSRFVAGPRWIPRSGISHRWTCIVIHHSASEVGGAAAFDRHHRNVRKWDELGYHFVIGNGTDTGDGQIEVGSRWAQQKHGAHCKTPDNYYNDHGIGICLVGCFAHHPPTPAQMDSLARLVSFLMRACDIDASRVMTHRGVTGRTECPGAKFSLAGLKARLDPGAVVVEHAR